MYATGLLNFIGRARNEYSTPTAPTADAPTVIDFSVMRRGGLSGLRRAVRCRGVAKEYGSGGSTVRALAGVDVEVAAGEMTLLAGPSGCGKTTLVSILAGLLSPTEGEVEILGTRLGGLSPAELVAFRRKHIGFVFQQYDLLPTLSAAENAAVPLVIAGMRWKHAIAKGREQLELLGLGAQ